jgi:pimeloyl-ACP methyl ester carboxylesterase
MEVRPFRVQIPQEALDDLRLRLRSTRWPDALRGSGWESGADLAFMSDLASHWESGFDWRAQEERINAWPHFRAEIDGLGIHLLHVRGRGPSPLPLVITHGWPGSFVEMLDLLPLLTDPAAHGADPGDAFDVVVPSLPGYGFSDRPAEPGMSPVRITALWARLMEGLGYRRFGAQGGDWGAHVSTRLALAHPDRVAGLHLNYIPGSYLPYLGPGARPLSEVELAFLEDKDRWDAEEGAYGHLQATFPQTVAYALNDSPAGLLAWIVEKFRAWGDCDGDVLGRFGRDPLLTNVTLYWVTGTIHSSMRLYREAAATPLRLGRDERVRVPCGVARFPKEAPSPPREWIERGYDVRRFTEMPRGGHFAALEEPGLLAADLRAFFRPLR